MEQKRLFDRIAFATNRCSSCGLTTPRHLCPECRIRTVPVLVLGCVGCHGAVHVTLETFLELWHWSRYAEVFCTQCTEQLGDLTELAQAESVDERATEPSYDDLVAQRYVENLWRRSVGAPLRPYDLRLPSLSQLRKSERCEAYRKLKDNRLQMGAYRHGVFGDPAKPLYDRVSDAIRRLKAYQKDGNLEHLVDAGNMCELEFAEGQHPRRHFAATDDGAHCGLYDPTPYNGGE